MSIISKLDRLVGFAAGIFVRVPLTQFIVYTLLACMGKRGFLFQLRRQKSVRGYTSV